MSTPIADAIRRIEDAIGDERYWTKGEYHHGIRRCLSGAVFDLFPDYPLPDPERTTLRHAIFRHLNSCLTDYSGHITVERFNDANATTHADVMLFLSTALDVAEAEGL
jgi:hypothetical protein